MIKKEHDEDAAGNTPRGAKAKYIVSVRGGIPQDLRQRISALQAKALMEKQLRANS